MERTPSFQIPLPKHIKNQAIRNFLFFWMFFIGAFLVIIACHDLMSTHLSDRFFYGFSPARQSWFIFIIGTLFLIVSGITRYLIKITQKQVQLIQTINHNFNQEISEHLKSEQSKKQLEMALLEGQKLQAIGTLAGGIAHDFNNILYAIIGYVEMAREDIPQDTVIFKNLGKVLEASHRGRDLVARILDFGRRNQRYEQKPFPINGIMEDALSLLRPAIPSSIRINVTDCTDCVVLGNQTQLHQVIVNIINNAVDAMYGEGTITIDISKVMADDTFLKQFPKLAKRDYCKVTISDTGHGMDQTTLKRIFEPFYTTKEVGKGTGLGLATVHGIILQHQGEVTVTSQLGIGTTFTLLFPEYQETPMKMETTNGNYSFSRR
ncbi:MAG: hypothetical protein JO131_02290 [Gammaproteobacteria bacterium]|nr:hypothetical protein [Gammaproteobacteria bacterium]